MAKQDLTAERLREVLHYDPETGLFTRRIRSAQRVHIGDIAGHTTYRGYVCIAIDNFLYQAHRLAWLYVTGEWPHDQIDHINGVRSENCWDNLREATNAQNQQNIRRPRINNKSGFLGVGRNGSGWQARIRTNGKLIHLGTYPTPELAHAAYLAAKAEQHPFQTLTDSQ